MLKTLDNSLKILNCFTKEKPIWGVRELAQEMNMSHSVVFRILKTFEKHGFIRQDKLTERYQIGIRFLEYSMISKDLFPINSEIKEIMQQLSQSVGEFSFLTWLDQYDCLCLEVVEVKQSIKFTVEKGSRTQIYAGASNKVIMAYLTDQEIEDIINEGLKPITPFTNVDPTKLKRDIEEVRQKGYCLTIGEYNQDVTGLAVPLFDSEEKIVASLTIAGPTYRISDEKIKEFLPQLIEAKNKIQPLIRYF